MLIIKIGGGNTINLQGIVEDLKGLNEPFIIVHGANSLRDRLAESLGIPRQVVTSVSGYDSVLSDKNTIDLQMMAYAGLRNKRLVEMCQQAGINAIGLSGLDGALIQGKRNRGIKVQEGNKKKLIHDFSGKPQEINRHLLDLLLNNNYFPVLCVPIIDETGTAINSENDDIVKLLQSVFQARGVVHLIEAPGFLADAANPDSLIKKLTLEELTAWEEKSEGRIKRKLLSLVKLMNLAPTSVYISDGRTQTPLKDALAGIGTVLVS